LRIEPCAVEFRTGTKADIQYAGIHVVFPAEIGATIANVIGKG
jgi:hypothetical protein